MCSWNLSIHLPDSAVIRDFGEISRYSEPSQHKRSIGLLGVAMKKSDRVCGRCLFQPGDVYFVNLKPCKVVGFVSGPGYLIDMMKLVLQTVGHCEPLSRNCRVPEKVNHPRSLS